MTTEKIKGIDNVIPIPIPSTKQGINKETFFTRYFDYIGVNEAPKIYHRWCAVSTVAALLGRQIYIPFGHDNIYPNFYILLVGDPGTRKNTAINPAKKVIKVSGYNKLSPDRLSPERFIIALEKSSNINDDLETLGVELENLTLNEPCELYVCIGEFGDFIGKGNFDFVKLLTNLWDNLPSYDHPKIHGRSIRVNKPTVNIIAGTTPQSISEDIPVAAIGQGFFSRFILVHGENSGIKITFPPPVPDEIVKAFSKDLIEIKTKVVGAITRTKEAEALLDRMYREFYDIDDNRFKHYSTRRFTHLLKLCMIMAATEKRTVILPEDCLNANTLLHYTEQRMPKALGEFGKAKNSDVVNGVMSIIRGAREAIVFADIYKQIAHDVGKKNDLIEILKQLRESNKVQVVENSKGKSGYVPKHEVRITWKPELLNDKFLTIDERN